MRTIIAGLALAAVSAAQEDKEFEEFRRKAQESEEAGKWKKIAWQKDLAAAIEKAKEESKPILVVLVVGKMGKKGAAEC
jgi:adenosyl cobinamide kinase/adenosyl cobinamide phosphate guanylyltransferase